MVVALKTHILLHREVQFVTFSKNMEASTSHSHKNFLKIYIIKTDINILSEDTPLNLTTKRNQCTYLIPF